MLVKFKKENMDLELNNFLINRKMDLLQEHKNLKNGFFSFEGIKILWKIEELEYLINTL